MENKALQNSTEKRNKIMKRGRPAKKPKYAPEERMQELIDTVAEVYREKHEIKATAIELDLPPNKVKKLLITGGVINYPETEQIQRLIDAGKTMEEVCSAMGLSRASINTYLPYSKVIYKLAEISQNAERVKKYKERKAVVEEMKMEMSEESLWNCIIAFQGYPFHTISGLTFTYTLKIGKGGAYTKELFIDRRENSKSLAWSSVRIAFRAAVEKRDTVFDRPKAIADVRGISYIYSLLWRFGVINISP